jgi:hypothetical protein
MCGLFTAYVESSVQASEFMIEANKIQTSIASEIKGGYYRFKLERIEV